MNDLADPRDRPRLIKTTTRSTATTGVQFPMPQEFDLGTDPKTVDVIERIVGGDLPPFRVDDPSPNLSGTEQFD